MRERLSPEQKLKSEKCEWRDKNFENLVLCPFANNCIKRVAPVEDAEAGSIVDKK